MIAECDNGDDACKSYQNLERDISLLVDMNVEMYRFSLSWPRLMPDGVTPNVNTGGLEYYNRLIDQLLANDITPMVTLYHWDLPSALAKVEAENVFAYYYLIFNRVTGLTLTNVMGGTAPRLSSSLPLTPSIALSSSAIA